MYKKILLLLFVTLTVTGCGIWNNFSTYFNLYYNTSNIFDEVETAINAQKRPVFSNDEIVVTGTTATLLNKVVEKTSRILQYKSNTVFVDDALFMLGKALYYQKSYQKANRKFNELITTQKESEYYLEAQLWSAKSLMMLQDYTGGIKELDSVINQAKKLEENEIASKAYIEIIKYNLFREQYDIAILEIGELLKYSEDDVLNSEIKLELGKLFARLNRNDEAIAAFEEVVDDASTYDIQYGASIELAKAYRKKNQNEKSLDMLDNLFFNNIFADKKSEVELETGLTYLNMDKIEEAMTTFKRIDTLYPASTHAGTAKYMIADMYEYDYNNYDSASKYYSRVLSSQAPKEYVTRAQEKDRLLKRYFTLYNSIQDNKLAFRYSTDTLFYKQDSLKIADSIKYVDKYNKAVRDSIATFGQLASNSQQPKTLIAPKIPVKPVISKDSIITNIVKNHFDMGNLFYNELEFPDSAYYYYNSIITQYPNSSFQAKALFAIANYYELKKENAKADSLINYVYDNYKTDPIVNAAANALKKPLVNFQYDPAEKIYLLAEKQLKEKNYDSSMASLWSIYKTFPKSSFASKSLYTHGYILEEILKKNDSAAAVYDTLLRVYPGNVYSNKISTKLYYYNSEKSKKRQAVADSLAKIEKAKKDLLKIETAKQDSINKVNSLSNKKIQVDTNRTKIDSIKTDSMKTVPMNNNAIPKDTTNINKNIQPEAVVPDSSGAAKSGKKR